MSLPVPRVSVGMAVYNGENFIRDAVESILGQTYADLELIICDNDSSDRTQQICEEYAAHDPRVRYYRNSRNLGVVPNLNRAFELSHGTYFKWADHDDILAPEFLERSVGVLDSEPAVVLCFPRTKVIDGSGNVLEEYDPLPKTDSLPPHTRFGNLILAPDGRAIQSMGLMRADAARKTGLNGSYPSSDEVFLAHLALLGEFREIPERLLYYRIHPKQSTKGVLASERARVLFVDTSLKGKTVLIKWPYLKDCIAAINTAPIGIPERVRCYGQLGRWLLLRKNMRSMTKDVLLAIHLHIPIFPRIHQEALDAANGVEIK
jgi:glycosyltransferase involved in cell wall biosynthesis